MIIAIMIVQISGIRIDNGNYNYNYITYLIFLKFVEL